MAKKLRFGKGKLANCDEACAQLGYHRIYAFGKERAYSKIRDALYGLHKKYADAGAVPIQEIRSLLHEVWEAAESSYEDAAL